MNRTQALCKAFGWQGGTIHQLAKETGCDSSSLLYGEATSTSLGSSYCLGWFAGRTCSLEHNLTTNFLKERGNVDFWLGVADGIIKQK